MSGCQMCRGQVSFCVKCKGTIDKFDKDMLLKKFQMPDMDPRSQGSSASIQTRTGHGCEEHLHGRMRVSREEFEVAKGTKCPIGKTSTANN